MFNPYKLEEPAAAASARSSGYSSGTSVEFMRYTAKINGSMRNTRQTVVCALLVVKNSFSSGMVPL